MEEAIDVAAFDTAVAPPVVPAASSDISSNGELVFIISCSPLKASLPSTLTASNNDAHPLTTHPNRSLAGHFCRITPRPFLHHLLLLRYVVTLHR